tara:strand:- start:66 stop:353 length:288 start_codon:yes stop_codon:yes gene_type:complete
MFMIRVIFLLALLLPLTLASPTLLAANNPKFASVDEAPVNLGESLEADAFLGYLRQGEEVQNIGPIWMLVMPISVKPENRRSRSILDRKYDVPES